MQCLLFRETKIHPCVIRARKSLRVQFCFIGIFWRILHGRLVFFTAETFKNLHGLFSRATENFRKSSRVSSKIHGQLVAAILRVIRQLFLVDRAKKIGKQFARDIMFILPKEPTKRTILYF